jgi:2-oxoglutarate ferredoxin oxidoreductase subunit alpha
MVELPLVIVNVQRGGPSTGLPTKTEQADLLQALYGRNGEASIPVIAASTPSDCFDASFEAVRIALKYMTPVMVLTDGYLGNGSEPWLIPDYDTLPDISHPFVTSAEGFQPYARDEQTLSRPWAIPGTAGLEHRIGGLEKEHITGNVSYDPENHDLMTRLRTEKIQRIANDIPLAQVEGEAQGELLVVGWGGTYGAIKTAVLRQRQKGHSVAHLHLRYLNPLPKNLGDILKQNNKILVPEINLGQLVKVLRATYLVDATGFNKVRGLPFRSVELEHEIEKTLKGNA